MAVGLGLAVAMRPSRVAAASVSFKNPFHFRPVLGFALFLGVYTVIAKYISERFGAAGTLTGTAVLGLANVDAVAVSLARIGSSSAHDAGFGILAAVAANALSELVIGAGIGGASFTRQVAVLAAACLGAGGLVLWSVLMFVAGD